MNPVKKLVREPVFVIPVVAVIAHSVNGVDECAEERQKVERIATPS